MKIFDKWKYVFRLTRWRFAWSSNTATLGRPDWLSNYKKWNFQWLPTLNSVWCTVQHPVCGLDLRTYGSSQHELGRPAVIIILVVFIHSNRRTTAIVVKGSTLLLHWLNFHCWNNNYIFRPIKVNLIDHLHAAHAFYLQHHAVVFKCVFFVVSIHFGRVCVCENQLQDFWNFSHSCNPSQKMLSLQRVFPQSFNIITR